MVLRHSISLSLVGATITTRNTIGARLGIAAVFSACLLSGTLACPQQAAAEDPLPVLQDEAPEKPAAVERQTAPVRTATEAAPVKEKKKEEKVKTGVIANTGTFGQSGAVNVSTDGSSPGDEPNAISGSVSVAGRGKCIATVTNSSKNNTYAVRFAVEGRNSSGASTLNKSFNATLAPKQTVSKDFTCREDDNMTVVLKSANKRG